jgi:hypothetical protein
MSARRRASACRDERALRGGDGNTQASVAAPRRRAVIVERVAQQQHLISSASAPTCAARDRDERSEGVPTGTRGNGRGGLVHAAGRRPSRDPRRSSQAGAQRPAARRCLGGRLERRHPTARPAVRFTRRGRGRALAGRDDDRRLGRKTSRQSDAADRGRGARQHRDGRPDRPVADPARAPAPEQAPATSWPALCSDRRCRCPRARRR